MNSIQRGLRSVIRKPVRSILLLLTVVIISCFFMAGLAAKNANIHMQETTRKAVGASFRLESNEENRAQRLQEASRIIGEKEGSYGGYHQEQLANGSWFGYTDHSFETIRPEDVEKISEVDGMKDYNLITVPTPVNPVNFKRIEDSDVDQSSDIGGVTLRGNRIMEMDLDVASGKIEMVEGRMIAAQDRNVCVVSKELAKLNHLEIGDVLEFNDYHDRENSKIYAAKIVGIYQAVQKITPYMHGDTYRSENIIFTDLGFPEKPEGYEGDPLYERAVFQVEDVNQYEQVKEAVQKVKIGWERYDLLDNSGNSISMAGNFKDLEKISQILLAVVAIAGFVILSLIFIFWIKNRTNEIGILMALGRRKTEIWAQILLEAFLIGIAAFVLSMAAAPMLSNITAGYLVRQQQEQAQEQSAADKGKISTDYIAPDQTVTDVQVNVTGGMAGTDALLLSILLFGTVSLASVSIMRKNPKEIFSEMS